MKYSHYFFILLSVLFGNCTAPKGKSVSSTGSHVKLEKKPNILWLVAEDLSPYIPSYGDSTIVTPSLDRLAAEGICYDNFYTPAPVCSPARAAIITGMYPTKIGASHMRTGPWMNGRPSAESLMKYAKIAAKKIPPYEAVPQVEVKMFPEYLRTEGYYCTNNGKEDYQFLKTPTAWDASSNKAHWRNRPDGMPFFSVFNLFVTHESQIWAKENDSLWVDTNLEVKVPPYLPDTEIGKRDMRRMYSNILEMDHQVGEILKQLEEDGLLENTIVIWYSDHGGPLPRQKRLLYESGIKVPMIVRFPNKRMAGKRDNRLISFIDLAPTMLSLTGIKPPSYMDGKAFSGSYARDIEPAYIFAAADRFDANYDNVRAVKDKRYKYLKYYKPEKSMFLHVGYRDQMAIMRELYRLRDSGNLTDVQKLWFRDSKPQEELFDTSSDPHEINNLAENPRYANKLIELRKACKSWVTNIDDTGLISESELLKRFWTDNTQPITRDPTISLIDHKIVLSNETQGSSIGYRIHTNGNISESWKIYTDAFSIPQGQTVEVIAQRLGYLPSKKISKTF